ncbi:MAG: alkaline phosphatase [Dokdonella sp.]
MERGIARWPLRARVAVTALALASLCACAAPSTRAPVPAAAPIALERIAHPQGETPQWWFRAGAAAAQRARGADAGQARNVIVFLGDGMSIGTIAAARILEGQRNGASGEEQRLSFEEFPHTALSRTYAVDAQTPDSAATMSAIMTGVKTRFGMLSVDMRALRGNCASSRNHASVTALELAASAGMATGIVTTTEITHATPAASYGHSPERDWEHDAAMPAAARAEGCIDLARQLVEFSLGTRIDIALGGGRSGFLPSATTDPEYAQLSGKRADGRNLINEWLAQGDTRFVWNAEQFAALDPSAPGRVLGLFQPEAMNYENDRERDAGGEPSLAEMTRAAIAKLQNHDAGYLLVVEGGRIDHGHHANNAFRALNETIAFSDAVRVADQATSANDTLILVTADHGHVMTFAGYPARGNPILGKLRGRVTEGAESSGFARDLGGRNYTTLGYANGPGHAGPSNLQAEGSKRFPHSPSRVDTALGGRPVLDEVDTEQADYLQESTVPLKSETHSGEDVALFARGPGAEGVRGSLEQNVLFHLIVQATPSLRERLCAMQVCDANGIPVELPAYERLRAR